MRTSVSGNKTPRWKIWTRGLALAIATLMGLCGCGSSTSPKTPFAQGSSTRTSKPATTSSAAAGNTTSSASTPSVPSTTYENKHIAFSANNFQFSLQLSVTLQTPQTNTDGVTPPRVNVSVPFEANASMYNETANYVVPGNQVPLVGLFGAYPSKDAICQLGSLGQPTFHPGPAGLCAVDIGELAAACTATFDTIQAHPGAPAGLTMWPQSTNDQLQVADPAPCAEGSYEPPTALTFAASSTSQAQAIEQEVRKPAYWVVVNESGASDAATGQGFSCQSDQFYVQGGTFLGSVITSQPGGVTGCIGANNP